MFFSSREWLPPTSSAAPSAALHEALPFDHAGLYRTLAGATSPDAAACGSASAFLRSALAQHAAQPSDLPDAPQDLVPWMEAATQTGHARYRAYLEQRRGGAPRSYFSNRAHALYFLRCVAPTKLVDGAWLYGLLRHHANPRVAGLVQTYLEELGEGAPDKNHVVLYRGLLARHGLDPLDDLPDALFQQGLVQLALGCSASDFLPEIVGFNLAYEQLPLHLLITAYELNELGIDPYYFTLHVTVDNADSGHARRACQAVQDLLPRLDDSGEFWGRVRNGGRLANAGVGTVEVIEGFDIDTELLRILARKATVGSGAHSDYCRLAGRSVNDWLAVPEDIPSFLDALQREGWIRRGEPAENSRYWKLLQGEHAEMFGVFSSYELQVIHDWIRGPASADGQAYTEHPAPGHRRPSFRAALRLGARRDAARQQCAGEPAAALDTDPALDPDLTLLTDQLDRLDSPARESLLIRAMSPASHWTPAGLHATRVWRDEHLM